MKLRVARHADNLELPGTKPTTHWSWPSARRRVSSRSGSLRDG